MTRIKYHFCTNKLIHKLLLAGNFIYLGETGDLEDKRKWYTFCSLLKLRYSYMHTLKKKRRLTLVHLFKLKNASFFSLSFLVCN